MTADIKTDIANEAVRIVTGARRAAYGKPEQNFERIARLWNAHLVNVGILRAGAGGMQTGDVAAFMRLMKEARLAETPDHRDSFVDLVGYALCGAEVAGVSVSEPEPEPISVEEAMREAYPPIAPVEPAPLQIEVGKFYRNASGERVGPFKANNDMDLDFARDYPFRCPSGLTYADNGAWYRGERDCHDLVAEWIEPAPDADGWIAWEGGEMPVPGGTLVDVRLRDGGVTAGHTASCWAWSREIVAYRVVKP